MKIKIVLWIFWSFVSAVLGVCFFNQDMQGYYLTQSTVSRGSAIDYLEVVVLQDSIPVWGHCHRRFGDNVILHDMVGDEECMRCFHIVARSTHILEIHTEGLERCYTNEGAAFTKCPTNQRKSEFSATEIMLYKTRSIPETKLSPPIYCPIEGKFLATYDVNDGTETVTECPSPYSLFSNCPRGNEISIIFRKCSFSDFEIKFECLAYWNDTNGQQFLALRDPTNDVTIDKSDHRSSVGFHSPKYRCALIDRDSSAGRIQMAFSSDSTCFNNLRSASDGFESLVLGPLSQPPLPSIVHNRKCHFPAWSQGKWEQLEVKENSMIFTDLQEYKTFVVHCIGIPQADLFPVYARNQCGEEMFSCLSMKQRGPNVIEIQLRKLEKSSYDRNLCLGGAVPRSPNLPRWITQGRVDRYRESPCPVAGEYIGTLPDEITLCAKLYSDCNNLEIMFYTVYSCANKSRIFEEREYRCLGQWVESGVTYTYTERRDISSHECFAGVVMSSEEIIIAEAGINCQRGIRPLNNGMKLLQQATCELDSTKYSGHPYSNVDISSNEINPLQDRNPKEKSSSSQAKSAQMSTTLVVLFFIFVYL